MEQWKHFYFIEWLCCDGVYLVEHDVKRIVTIEYLKSFRLKLYVI